MSAVGHTSSSGLDERTEAWQRAEDFMERWNERGNPRRFGPANLYETTLRLARFLADDPALMPPDAGGRTETGAQT